MTVADTANRDTGNEVQILIPIDVDNDTTSGAVHHDLRIERDRLEARRHCLRLAIEDRFGLGARHDATLSAVLWYRFDRTQRDVVHASTPRRSHDARAPLEALG